MKHSKMKFQLAMLIVVVTVVGSLAMPAQATEKPHGSPDPQAPPADWREDYAYHLEMEAYIFSYPWVFLPEIRSPGW